MGGEDLGSHRKVGLGDVASGAGLRGVTMSLFTRVAQASADGSESEVRAARDHGL